MVDAVRFEDFLKVQESASAQWNELLFKCQNPNVFSTYEWGEYKKKSWIVERIVFLKGSTFIGVSQIMFKKKGSFLLGWCSSGINLVDFNYLPDAIASLRTKLNMKRTAIRFNFFDASGDANSFLVDSIKELTPVKKSINSGYTIRFNLENKFDEKDYSKNNRYYLKKAKTHQLQFNWGKFDPESFVKVHTAMVEHKGLSEIKISQEEMTRLSLVFGDHLNLATVQNEQGEILSAALIIIFKSISYYFLAGSSPSGREQSASFFMLDEILKKLKDLQVREFDFGGITPFKENAQGVSRFKMGFHGKVVRYIGERNLCDSDLFKRAFDIALTTRIS